MVIAAGIGAVGVVLAAIIASDPQGPDGHRELLDGQRELREGQEQIREELRRLSEQHREADPSVLASRYGGEWALVYITPEGSAVGDLGTNVEIEQFQAELRVSPGLTSVIVHALIARIGNRRVAAFKNAIYIPGPVPEVIQIPWAPWLAIRWIATGPDGSLLGALTAVDHQPS